MITFHKHPDNKCLDCYETAETLKNLVVAHTVAMIDNKSIKRPTITEGKKIICGHKAIKLYIEDLQKTMDLWQKFQGDSCYIDSDGKIC